MHAALAPATPGRASGLDTPTNALTIVYGLVGFGYIITATLLPTIARKMLFTGSPWPDLP